MPPGFEDGATGDPDDTPDNGTAFTADDTEFNIFNTDRRLDALQTLADELAGIEQKKSVIYFSSGMSQQGTDNQVELRRTIDRANRANVSIYAADMRGLQAMVPGGDATQGSRRGTSAFSGRVHAESVQQPGRDAGHADDDGRGHRRPRLLRLELLRRRVRPGRRRYVRLLRARLQQHQPGPRRAVPPHQGAAQAHRI